MQTDRVWAQGAGGGVVASLVGAIICFTATVGSAEGPLKFAGTQLEPIKWTGVAAWKFDDHLAAFAAYQASCQALRKRRPDELGQIAGALSNVCRRAANLRLRDADTARAFFEQNFQPVRIARLGEAEGLLTGYFEPVVAGSRFPGPEFPVPLYRRPRDLVAAGYKPGSLAFPNKGAQIGRRNENNELVPYYDRGAIEAGALDGQRLEICWLRDPLDLLTIQIEGSGRVILEDGTPLRVNYDAHNGYHYSSIERVLIDRNLIARNEISPQRVRDWMAAHPDEATKVRAANQSYVFFRVTGLSNEGEPVGAQGVPLTPGRSIAVDRMHEYGTPFFIEANLRIESGKPASPFRRLMIAQDTGSAIVGPARADLYWGAGDDAGRIAGRIHHPGRFVMLLPRELDMVLAGKEMPLPVPKPKIAALEVAKKDSKGTVDLAGTGVVAGGTKMPSPLPGTKIATLAVEKHDGKGAANSANARTIAIGNREPLRTSKIAVIEVVKEDRKVKAKATDAGATASSKPSMLPVVKPKNPAIEVKKQDGKGKAESADKSSGTVAAGRPKPLPAPTKISENDVRKQDAKSKANSASIVAIASGDKQKPPPAAKSKTPAIEAKKQGGKGKGEGGSASEDTRAAARVEPVSRPHAKESFVKKD
jgi:membrane-bound lytic murein transglycosylase A